MPEQVQKKTIKLQIKVPKNVEIVTEVVDSGEALSVASGPADKKLVLDLTTEKTGQWLESTPGKDMGGGCCCCVRG